MCFLIVHSFVRSFVRSVVRFCSCVRLFGRSFGPSFACFCVVVARLFLWLFLSLFACLCVFWSVRCFFASLFVCLLGRGKRGDACLQDVSHETLKTCCCVILRDAFLRMSRTKRKKTRAESQGQPGSRRASPRHSREGLGRGIFGGCLGRNAQKQCAERIFFLKPKQCFCEPPPVMEGHDRVVNDVNHVKNHLAQENVRFDFS